MHLRRSSLAIIGALAVLAGCKSSGTAYNPPSSFLTAHAIVVSDVVDNTILTFSLDANGSGSAPVATLGGNKTNLNQPEGFFVDKAHGTIWVGNYSGGSSGSITEYRGSANGNMQPIATIGGTNTTIKGPGGIYVDSAGNVYLADYQNDTIDVFAAGSTGNVAPTRQITGVSIPSGLWLDGSGNIWVGSPYSGEIYEFANNANGAATPLATITSPALSQVMGVFIDRHNDVWAANCSGKNVVEFTAGSTGSGLTPAVDISGTNTGFVCPNGVVVDVTGRIYVADYGAPAVYVFASGSNGDATPTQTIPAGGATTLGKPIGVIVY